MNQLLGKKGGPSVAIQQAKGEDSRAASQETAQKSSVMRRTLKEPALAEPLLLFGLGKADIANQKLLECKEVPEKDIR